MNTRIGAKFLIAAFLAATLAFFIAGSQLSLTDADAAVAAEYVYIFSPSHPEPDTWYDNNDPLLTWSVADNAAIVAYSQPALHHYYYDDVSVSGNYAYVGAESGDLQIIDISDPVKPAIAGSFQVPDVPCNYVNADCWTQTRSVAVSGDMVYLGYTLFACTECSTPILQMYRSDYLAVLDISNPTGPVLLGSYEFSNGQPNGLAVVGDYVLIAAGDGGLQIVDTADPENAALAGYLDTPGYARDVYASGNYAYIADGTYGLQIVDISDPNALTLVGGYDTPGTALSISLAGQNVFVADGSAGLQVIDVSNPALPSLLGSHDTPASAQGIKVTGNRVFIADESDLQSFVVDDPANPVPDTSYNVGKAINLDLAGNYAFVVGGHEGLSVVDITAASRLFSFFLDQSPSTIPDSLPEGADHFTSYSGLQDGEYWFHIATIDGGSLGPVSHRRVLIETDCSSQPDLRIHDPEPYWRNYQDYIAGQLSVEYAISNEGTNIAFNTTLTGMSVNGPVSLCAYDECGLGPVEAIGSSENMQNPKKISVYGDHAFIATHHLDQYWADDFKVFDVSNPFSPELVGTYDMPTVAKSMAFQGNFAFIAGYYTGIVHIVDMTDPANPVFVSSLDIPSPAEDMVVSGNHVFVADGNSGLQIIDISDIANPTLVGSYEGAGTVKSVAVQDEHVYITSDPNGLTILDISNPQNPFPVGSFSSWSVARDVALYGKLALLAYGDSGLIIVDVSNPTSPTQVSSFDTYGSALEVALSDHYAYIIDGEGLKILDFINPSRIRLVGVYDNSVARSVAASGGYAYLLDWGQFTVIDGIYSELLMPVVLGDLLPGDSLVMSFKFAIPTGVSRFHTGFAGTANDVCGNSYTYGV